MPESLAGATLAAVALAAVCGLVAVAMPRQTRRDAADPLGGIVGWVRAHLARPEGSRPRVAGRVADAGAAIGHWASDIGAIITTWTTTGGTRLRAMFDGVMEPLRAEQVRPVLETGPMFMSSDRDEGRRRGFFRRRREEKDDRGESGEASEPSEEAAGTTRADAVAPPAAEAVPEAELDAEQDADELPAAAHAVDRSDVEQDDEELEVLDDELVPPPPRPKPRQKRPTRRPALNYIPLDASTAPSAEDGEAGEESLSGRFRRGLRKTRDFLNRDVREVFGAGPVPEAFDSLEELLVRADVGVATALALSEELRARGRELTSDNIQEALRQGMRAQLRDADRKLRVNTEGVSVWLIVGVNGSGKTTSVAKLARHAKELDFNVCVAAADTYRAAAIEQLETWAERIDVDIVRQHPGADSAAVVFDAIQHAKAAGHDLVIADTAGRLHTRAPLMDELRKVRRVIEREEGALTETLLVLDATTGQNGINQAKAFQEAVGVTGLILTRLDSTAKGGIVVAVERELGIPVKAVGIGEKATDLAPFDPDAFVDAIFGSATVSQ